MSEIPMEGPCLIEIPIDELLMLRQAHARLMQLRPDWPEADHGEGPLDTSHDRL